MTQFGQRLIKSAKEQTPAPALERRTHIALAGLLHRTCEPGWWWPHIPSGEYRTLTTGALLQRMGTKAGMFDFLFISPNGVHHWLELKRGSQGQLSMAQILFRTELQSRGVPYGIARSFDGAVSILTGWGVLDGVKVQ